MWKPRTARGLRISVACVAGLVPLAAAVAVPTVASAAAPDTHRPATADGGNWMGIASDTSYQTTLATVRDTINADTGAAAGLTGKGVGIALVDTGVAPVPGLRASQIVNGPDLSIESQSDHLRYLDSYGHGTHMAGIMVANDPATGTKGIAPEAQLTSVRVGTGNGAADVTQTIAAIDWVVQHRNDDPANPIRIINLSYGSDVGPAIPLCVLEHAAEIAWKAGIVVVAAGGNMGNKTGYLTSPANDPWMLSVGASISRGTAATSDDKPSTFTNTSPLRNIDLWAPGDSVTSLRDPGSAIDTQYPTARVGETLFKGTGTSQAAAVVSASAALILQAHPELTPDKLKTYLMNSSQDGGSFWVGLLRNPFRQIDVNNALKLISAQPTLKPKTPLYVTLGFGLVQPARGNSQLLALGTALYGNRTLMGSVETFSLAARTAGHTTWSGGVWMGFRMASDGWDGTSWASRTWGSATWKNTTWFGTSDWSDPSWSGRYWSGRYWSGDAWNGRYWSNDAWLTSSWN